ncbi:MAG: polysaccharide deacetylase family protein [Thermus sp.]
MLALLLALAPLPLVEGYAPPKTLLQEPLPSLTLRLPQVVRATYLGNGHIEVGYVLLQVAPGETSPARLLRLAQEGVRGALEARAGLAEVDLAIYPAPYSGPQDLPLFTASIPKSQVPEFLSQGNPSSYGRLWFNPGFRQEKALEPVLEDRPRYEGPEAYWAKEKAEQILSSRVGYRGGVLYHGNPGRPYVALTFDDAPHPLFTPLLLDLLRREGIRATFFVIGRNAEAYPYFVRDLVAAGYELGNHTYHHLRLPGLEPGEIRRELLLCNQVLEHLTGAPPRYFRPPGGRYDRNVLQVARDLGLTTVFWTDDPGDYAGLPLPLLEKRLEAHLRPGGIVLLHDNVVNTLRVLPIFIQKARAQGLTLGTVGGLVLGQR